MATSLRVGDFLAPISRVDTFAAAVETFIAAARDATSGPDVRRVYSRVKAALRDPQFPLLSPEQAAMYDEVKRSDRRPAEPSQTSEFVEPLVQALYLRATHAMSAKDIAAVRRAFTGPGLARVEGNLAALPNKLLGDILVESERRMSSSPHFARQMETAAAELRDLRDRYSGLAEEWRAAIDNSDEDGCTCVAVGCNNKGDCQEFCLGFWDCLLLLLGVILVIILL